MEVETGGDNVTGVDATELVGAAEVVGATEVVGSAGVVCAREVVGGAGVEGVVCEQSSVVVADNEGKEDGARVALAKECEW